MPRVDRPLAVVDVDGVVADVRHRLHHLDGPRTDWAAFFAAAAADPALPEGLAVVETLRLAHEVVFLTGRPENLRAVTERWLGEHGLPTERVLMRRDGDRRPARQFKAEALRRLHDGNEVAIVVDDDPDVCDTVERAGWPVLRADWVPRAAPLAVAQRAGRT